MNINLREVKQYGGLKFYAKQAVEGFLIGLHKSPFKGFSVEFAEHKPYISGESTRHIDWKLYSKTDKLYVKEYNEETNLRCYIIIDSSSSMRYESGGLSKLDFSAIVASTIIQLLNKQRDSLCLLEINKDVVYQSESKSSPLHASLLIDYLESLLSKKEEFISTDLTSTLHDIARQIHKRSLVILFSDLMDNSSSNDELVDALNHIKYSNNEVVVIQPLDMSKEINLELENKPYALIDIETGVEMKISPSEVQKKYKETANTWLKDIKTKCDSYKIELIQADINQNIEEVLLPFLIKRSKMN